MSSFVRLYLSMTKPTISLLVVVSALPALLVAAEELPSLWLVMLTALGVYLMSASAAVFNQVLEWKIDGTMSRTRARSLPSGRLARHHGSLFGWCLGLAGFAVLYVGIHPLAAYIALAGHLYYVLLYTLLLKKMTSQNIVIGGAAGAVGPLIGAAAAGNVLSPVAWLLFLLIFLWTPPHFWSLSLKYQKDYAAAGIPMYPVVHGEQRTRKNIFIYTLTLLPTAAALIVTDLPLSTLFACIMTLYFIHLSWKLYATQDNERAMPLFHYSCLYALLIFLALSVEQYIAFLLLRS